MAGSSRSAGGDDAVRIDRDSPEETFASLANEIRLGILQVMMDAPDEPHAFSDLYERVNVDDPGQFNYHLGQLRERFVRKGPEGYTLTHAGREIVGAIYAGTYTANADVDPIELGDICITCGGTLRVGYANESARITCADCDRRSDEYWFPPRGLDQFSRAELPAAIDRWMGHFNDGVMRGFCPICTGRVEGRLVVEGEAERLADFPAHAVFACGRCGLEHAVPGSVPVTHHPTFRAFLFEHGLDIYLPIWDIMAELGRPTAELLSAEPPRMSLTYQYAGERFTGIVEPDATVVEVERERIAED